MTWENIQDAFGKKCTMRTIYSKLFHFLKTYLFWKKMRYIKMLTAIISG